MIEFMQESSGNVLGVHAGRKLTANDYKDRLVPRLESLIERFGKVRVLFYMDETFQGWDLKSAWANTTSMFATARTLSESPSSALQLGRSGA
jgi:hypothetical protein